MAWSTSDRASRLPPDWPKLRAEALARDGHRCQARIHVRTCDGVATEIDHIIPGDNHALSNLQSLSTPCHKAKTARENAARRQALARDLRRPVESHPGRM